MYVGTGQPRRVISIEYESRRQELTVRKNSGAIEVFFDVPDYVPAEIRQSSNQPQAVDALEKKYRHRYVAP